MLVPYLQILHGVAAHHLQVEDRLLAWLLLSMRSTRLESAPASRGRMMMMMMMRMIIIVVHHCTCSTARQPYSE